MASSFTRPPTARAGLSARRVLLLVCAAWLAGPACGRVSYAPADVGRLPDAHGLDAPTVASDDASMDAASVSVDAPASDAPASDAPASDVLRDAQPPDADEPDAPPTCRVRWAHGWADADFLGVTGLATTSTQVFGSFSTNSRVPFGSFPGDVFPIVVHDHDGLATALVDHGAPGRMEVAGGAVYWVAPMSILELDSAGGLGRRVFGLDAATIGNPPPSQADFRSDRVDQAYGLSYLFGHTWGGVPRSPVDRDALIARTPPSSSAQVYFANAGDQSIRELALLADGSIVWAVTNGGPTATFGSASVASGQTRVLHTSADFATTTDLGDAGLVQLIESVPGSSAVLIADDHSMASYTLDVPGRRLIERWRTSAAPGASAALDDAGVATIAWFDHPTSTLRVVERDLDTGALRADRSYATVTDTSARVDAIATHESGSARHVVLSGNCGAAGLQLCGTVLAVPAAFCLFLIEL